MSDLEDPPGFMPAAAAERRHTEDKAWKARHHEEHDGLLARVVAIETKLDVVLERTRPSPPWQKIAVLLAAIIALTGAAAAVARTPSPEELDRLRRDVIALQIEQVRLHAAIDAVLLRHRGEEPALP